MDIVREIRDKLLAWLHALLHRYFSRRELFRASVTPHESAFTAGVWGLDVSKWQGDIDFKAAKSEGIQFVIAKVCEGDHYFDPMYQSNYIGAVEAGLLFIPYIYIRPGVKTAVQIDTITQALGGAPVDGIMFDCETRDGVPIQTCTDVIWAIVNKFKGVGTKGVSLIYSRKSWWDPNVKRSSNWAKVAGAMVAHWGVASQYVAVPTDWPDWDVWQAGQVHDRFGVKGDVDFCVWKADKFPGNPPPPPPTGITAVITVDGIPHKMVEVIND